MESPNYRAKIANTLTSGKKLEHQKKAASPTPTSDYGQSNNNNFWLQNSKGTASRRRGGADNVLMGAAAAAGGLYPLTERKNQDITGQNTKGELATVNRKVKFQEEDNDSTMLKTTGRAKKRGEVKSQSAMKYRRTLSMNDYKQFKYIEEI